jgi:iron complex transport system substrate-binding protein
LYFLRAKELKVPVDLRPNRFAALGSDYIGGLTRRELIKGAGALAAGWALAGCSPNSDPAEPEATPGGTIKVSNEFGEFEIPVNPRRVIGWEGRRDLETALAVGLKPIAIGSNAVYEGKLAPYLDFDLDGVTIIEQTEPNLELIASLKPDLILTRDSNIEALHAQIRTLAPLVPVKPDGPWRADLEQAAAALGRTAQLRETLAGYDERRSEIRARHMERINRAVMAVVQYTADNRTFYSSSTTGFYLQANTIADLGGKYLPFLEQGGETIRDDGFSLERAEELAAADAIVLISNTPADRADLDSSELWKRLPAVAAGRVVETDFRTNYGSVYAATACLDLLDKTYATLA